MVSQKTHKPWQYDGYSLGASSSTYLSIIGTTPVGPLLHHESDQSPVQHALT
jgi:hypothetical protein